MAGYLASSRQWARVIREWEGVRQTFSAPVFHAQRFFTTEGFKSDYAGWDQEKRESYVLALVEVLTSHRLTRINHGVDVAAFLSLSEDERRHLTGGILSKDYSKWKRQGPPTKPYFLSFMHCLRQCIQATEAHLKVNLICDEQGQYSKNASTWSSW